MQPMEPEFEEAVVIDEASAMGSAVNGSESFGEDMMFDFGAHKSRIHEM